MRRLACVSYLAAAAFFACAPTADDGLSNPGDGPSSSDPDASNPASNPSSAAPDASSARDARAADGGAAGSDAEVADGARSDTGANGSDDAGPPPAYCKTNPWQGLEACGWPGPANTGYDASACPGGALEAMGSGGIIEVNQDNTVISCKKISGSLHITAKNVTIQNSYVAYDSGKRGVAANGTAVISVDDGASATIDHVEINGLDGVHACIWHQGTSMSAHYVNCYGINDGIFSWADTGYSPTTGDNFTIDHSYFHDLTTATANGHEDGYQTEGASNGHIFHNTYMLTTEADSCIAIWDSLKTSNNILVEDNLMTGGGAAVYSDDYSPSETRPQGGFSVTNTAFKNNVFSTRAAPCVGEYFVWYARPAEPYGGGPTDGWTRTGNYVLETGENVDDGNPHVGGQLCQ